jgi:signal transduction histidine kinase/ActR/RegA family two-component response regulator
MLAAPATEMKRNNPMMPSSQLLDFQRVFESVPGLYLILDTSLKIVAVSEAYLHATMTRRESLLGKHLFDAFPDNPQDENASGVANLRASLHRVLDLARPDAMAIQKYDIRQPESEGGGFVERYWSPVNTPVLDADGIVTHIIHAVEDVTQVIRLQQQGVERTDSLRREQQARAGAESANHRKDQLLAVLSHELRTPLTPVLAWVNLLRSEKNLSPQMQEGLEVIFRNVQLETRLIEDILDATRLSNAQLNLTLQPVDAHQCMKDAYDLFRRDAEAKQLDVVIDLAAARHDLKADPIRLQQVFWNLIGNAVKYTPIGGKIVVRSSNPDPETLRMEVIDTGIGIEPNVISRLFKSFEQGERTLSRKYGGLGLGLSIAKALVELHHGTLSVASAGKDRGSTFTVDLGVVHDSTTEMSAPAVPQEPIEEKQLRLLVVEDNEDTLKILSRILQKSGHAVTTATTVKAAVNAATACDFDLLISDIGLPDGTGWELMEKLQMIRPMPGIAVSGFIQPEDAERSKEAGFCDHLGKPLDLSRLRAAIEQATNCRTVP